MKNAILPVYHSDIFMADFRFEGLYYNGKKVQGVLTAENFSEAKRKIKLLAENRKFKVENINKRRVFIYRAKKGNEKPVRGEVFRHETMATEGDWKG